MFISDFGILKQFGILINKIIHYNRTINNIEYLTKYE